MPLPKFTSAEWDAYEEDVRRRHPEASDEEIGQIAGKELGFDWDEEKKKAEKKAKPNMGEVIGLALAGLGGSVAGPAGAQAAMAPTLQRVERRRREATEDVEKRRKEIRDYLDRLREEAREAKKLERAEKKEATRQAERAEDIEREEYRRSEDVAWREEQARRRDEWSEREWNREAARYEVQRREREADRDWEREQKEQEWDLKKKEHEIKLKAAEAKAKTEKEKLGPAQKKNVELFLKTYHENVSGLPEKLARVRRMKQQLRDGLMTGPIVGRVPEIARHTFSKAQEQFDMNAKALALDEAGKLKGALSDRDLSILMKSTVGTQYSEKTNLRALNALEEALVRSIADADAKYEYLDENGTLEGFSFPSMEERAGQIEEAGQAPVEVERRRTSDGRTLVKMSDGSIKVLP